MKFLVMAFRYGTNEYIFPVGVFDSFEEAEYEANEHRMFRGGKYEHKVYMLQENKTYDAEESIGIWVNGDNKKK